MISSSLLVSHLEFTQSGTLNGKEYHRTCSRWHFSVIPTQNCVTSFGRHIMLIVDICFFKLSLCVYVYVCEVNFPYLSLSMPQVMCCGNLKICPQIIC